MPDTDLILRTERVDDADAIDEVVRQAFGERDAEVELVRDIRNSDRYVPGYAWVAEVAGQVVGHIMLSYIDVGDDQALLLSPLAVHPDHHRRGIGRALTEAVIERARVDGEPVILVLGIPALYPKFGFVDAEPRGFPPPSEGIPDGAWMVLVLREGHGLRGRVSFPAAFDATSS